MSLGLLEPQHAANLLRWQVAVEQFANLGQGKTQVLQREDAVEPGQLVGRVVPVAGEAVHFSRLEQTDLVVVAQCLHRYLAESRKVSDFEHCSHSVHVS